MGSIGGSTGLPPDFSSMSPGLPEPESLDEEAILREMAQNDAKRSEEAEKEIQGEKEKSTGQAEKSISQSYVTAGETHVAKQELAETARVHRATHQTSSARTVLVAYADESQRKASKPLFRELGRDESDAHAQAAFDLDTGILRPIIGSHFAIRHTTEGVTAGSVKTAGGKTLKVKSIGPAISREEARALWSNYCSLHFVLAVIEERRNQEKRAAAREQVDRDSAADAKSEVEKQALRKLEFQAEQSRELALKSRNPQRVFVRDVVEAVPKLRAQARVALETDVAARSKDREEKPVHIEKKIDLVFRGFHKDTIARGSAW